MEQIQSALCGNVIFDSLVPHTMVVVLREMYTNVFTSNIIFGTVFGRIRDHVFLVERTRDMISSSPVCDLFHNELVVDGSLHYIFA